MTHEQMIDELNQRIRKRTMILKRFGAGMGVLWLGIAAMLVLNGCQSDEPAKEVIQVQTVETERIVEVPVETEVERIVTVQTERPVVVENERVVTVETEKVVEVVQEGGSVQQAASPVVVEVETEKVVTVIVEKPVIVEKETVIENTEVVTVETERIVEVHADTPEAQDAQSDAASATQDVEPTASSGILNALSELPPTATPEPTATPLPEATVAAIETEARSKYFDLFMEELRYRMDELQANQSALVACLGDGLEGSDTAEVIELIKTATLLVDAADVAEADQIVKDSDIEWRDKSGDRIDDPTFEMFERRFQMISMLIGLPARSEPSLSRGCGVYVHIQQAQEEASRFLDTLEESRQCMIDSSAAALAQYEVEVAETEALLERCGSGEQTEGCPMFAPAIVMPTDYHAEILETADAIRTIGDGIMAPGVDVDDVDDFNDLVEQWDGLASALSCEAQGEN